MSSRNLLILTLLLALGCAAAQPAGQPCRDDGSRLVLQAADLDLGSHHTRHRVVFGKYSIGLNLAVLAAIDEVQSHAMDGGGYFVGKDSIPTESPVCYNLALFGRPLIQAPRPRSYCSGATYTAFIEALNLLLPQGGAQLSEARYEALRMQEPDGGRREDGIKAWGWWNADGFGTHFSLVQYLGMGEPIDPARLRPGDFVNVSWKSGLGHSVIFLGWVEQGTHREMLYWSSQRATNGYGDQRVPLDRIRAVKAVRLTRPDNLFRFDPGAPVVTTIPGDTLFWPSPVNPG